MARTTVGGFSEWAALPSVGFNLAQAGALKGANAAKRVLEARLQETTVALANAENRAPRAGSDRDAEARARTQAEATARPVTAERVEHRKTRALLAKVRAELAAASARAARLPRGPRRGRSSPSRLTRKDAPR